MGCVCIVHLWGENTVTCEGSKGLRLLHKGCVVWNPDIVCAEAPHMASEY